MGAQSAEVRLLRWGLCWFARFKAVELSSVLMESYLYVAKRHAPAFIIVQLRLVFNRFFYFLEIFSERMYRYEQTEKQHFRGRGYRAGHSL